MAPLNFSNSDFINAKTSTGELISALENASAQKGPRRGVRQSANTITPQQAEANLKIDISNILQSPLTRPPPSGYGTLSSEAVRASRQLHAAATKFLASQVPVVDPVIKDEEGASDADPSAPKYDAPEIRLGLEALVSSIYPSHPFLPVEEGEEEEVAADEWEDVKKAPPKKKATRKNALSARKKGKLPVGKSGTRTRAQRPPPRIGPRRSDRIAGQKVHINAAQDEVKEVIDGNESEAQSTEGDDDE